MNRNKSRTVASRAKTNTGGTAKNNKPPVEATDSKALPSQEKNETSELAKDSIISSKSSSGRGNFQDARSGTESIPQDIDDLKMEIEKEEQLLKLLEANYQEILQSSKEMEQVLTFVNKESVLYSQLV